MRHVPAGTPPVIVGSWVRGREYVTVAGRWVYLYRVIDQYGQVIDVLVSKKRETMGFISATI
jgi:transposase-like protein